MKAVESPQQQQQDCNLETPTAELVDKLRVLMDGVPTPPGNWEFNTEQHQAFKEFSCNLPVSKGFNSETLHILYRIVITTLASGHNSNTLDWPKLLGVWTAICVRGDRKHLIPALAEMLPKCFEPGRVRVIGLVEMEWDPDKREIAVRKNLPNLVRVAEYLITTLRLDPAQQPATTEP